MMSQEFDVQKYLQQQQAKQNETQQFINNVLKKESEARDKASENFHKYMQQ